MNNGIPKSIPQGSYGTDDAENRRIREISDELQRLCRLHEEKSRAGQADGNRFEIEQRVTEQFAKSMGMWIPMDSIFDLGLPGPSGNENDTYVSGDSIYKVNNLLNSNGVCKLLNKVLLHNIIFPNTFYKLHGFAGYNGRSVMPVLIQRRIRNAQPATQIMIDTYMAALGFTKQDSVGKFSNGVFLVWDVVPRNVLVDSDGDMYVVDAEIGRISEK